MLLYVQKVLYSLSLIFICSLFQWLKGLGACITCTFESWLSVNLRMCIFFNGTTLAVSSIRTGKLSRKDDGHTGADGNCSSNFPPASALLQLKILHLLAQRPILELGTHKLPDSSLYVHSDFTLRRRSYRDHFQTGRFKVTNWTSWVWLSF